MSENYVEANYTELDYVVGDSVSTVVCDLSLVSSKIDSNSVDLKTILDNFNSMLSVVNNSFSSLHANIFNLLAKVENNTSDLINIKSYLFSNNFISLNGNGCEFLDGTNVKVAGRDVVYSVARSFVSLYSDNGYTVHYDLVSDDGYKLTVPEALLTKYV
ncbi:MAG: hypothetical protein PHX44_01690 [Sulfurimonas sp.]|uniref:hypothetical protein n=1 Tax=Sulfurimonas sp. TaxID=2022749 RepID=UPI00260D71BC|nr:hypothetical protein [Sulfurimonas sp.]MDD2651730.1 hypothetical protein [Sulfurimonas sp.]MDD2651747.1 hypothetical protein [Sulfurimonas sp.]MDD3451701.1 hypothetical protein [Sulfurimonas sp.]MDD3451718.1 hypothetical protein [Sulfurimonas sp.]